eukprot:m.84022 g.84022  ORF g.84022 m.84022 type:complete len:555 (-) comp9576_c0_seq1:1413-3077(-)
MYHITRLDNVPQFLGDKNEKFPSRFLPIFNPFRNLRPDFTVSWLSQFAVLNHRLLLLLCPKLEFKAIVLCPRIAKIRVKLDRLVVPTSRLLELAFRVKEIGHRQKNKRVVLASLHGVHTPRASCWLGFHEDGMGPQETRVWAFLQCSGHERLGILLKPSRRLHTTSFQPQLGASRDLRPALLKQRPSAGKRLATDLEACCQNPQCGRFRVVFTTLGVHLPCCFNVPLLLLHLPTHHPQAWLVLVDLDRLVQQLDRRGEVSQCPLQPGRFPPHPRCPSLVARILQQGPRPRKLVGLRLELDRREPNFLRVWVGREGGGENGLRRLDIPIDPLLLGAHQPQDLGLRAVLDGLGEVFIEGRGVAVLLFKKGRLEPERLVFWERGKHVGVHGAGTRVRLCLDGILRILQPLRLAVFGIHAFANDGTHDGLRGGNPFAGLGLDRFLDPLLPVDFHAVFTQRFDRCLDNLFHVGNLVGSLAFLDGCLVVFAFFSELGGFLLEQVSHGFFQLGGCNPNGAVGRTRQPCLVQNILRILVRFEMGQSEPELHRVGTALNRALQ